MNSWPGPENSWEGVDAYFTWANSPGMLLFISLLVVVMFMLALFGQLLDMKVKLQININNN